MPHLLAAIIERRKDRRQMNEIHSECFFRMADFLRHFLTRAPLPHPDFLVEFEYRA